MDGDITLLDSLAICLHLADRFPEKQLAPPVGSAERGLYYRWMTFAELTLDPVVMEFYRHAQPSEAKPPDEALARHRARLTAVLDVIHAGLEGPFRPMRMRRCVVQPRARHLCKARHMRAVESERGVRGAMIAVPGRMHPHLSSGLALVASLLLTLSAGAARAEPGNKGAPSPAEGVSLAAGAPHGAPGTGETPSPAAGVTPHTGTLAQAQAARWNTRARLGAELGGGMLGTVGGGLIGGASLGLLGFASCTGGGLLGKDFCILGLATAGAVLGGGIGMPLGIAWGGAKAGGNGSAWGAAGGVLVSATATGLVLFSERPELAGPVALTAPLLGIIGYELTDTEPGKAVTPTFTLRPGGGSLGLQGSF